MKSNEYHIEEVAFYYNGKDDLFLMFLRSVIRDYICADPITPDEKNISESSV